MKTDVASNVAPKRRGRHGHLTKFGKSFLLEAMGTDIIIYIKSRSNTVQYSIMEASNIGVVWAASF